MLELYAKPVLDLPISYQTEMYSVVAQDIGKATF
jgi:hypothetical protein